ncbi:MAG: DUF2924 domain-containing protein [Proteobacteria bacterium]|nr:DUF2924 domain-containing protein [Pseudomonadota bacterium]
MNAATQLKTVDKLKTKALREKLEELTGKQTRSNNRPYLLKQVIKALEEQAAREAAKAKPKSKRTAQKPRERDPRLPPVGTILEREHKGKKICATILDDGFEYHGKTYRSLSAVAREATGTIWNGFLFFKVIPYARREQLQSEGGAR